MTNRTSNPLPIGRTGHACVQCRERKQRCGGFTHEIKCGPCRTREVECSFQEEANDPRFNPYLRLGTSRSPPFSADKSPHGDASSSTSASARLHAFPAVMGRNGDWEAGSGPYQSSNEGNVARQVESLRSQLAELERRLGTTLQAEEVPKSSAWQPQPEPSFVLPSNPTYEPVYFPTQALPPLPAPTTIPTSVSPQDVVCIDGPLSALSSIQTDSAFEVEINDPIDRSILTEGEAHVMFRLYFSRCHPNAPFLYVDYDSDLDRVRSSSKLLLLAILCVGARFWSYSSRSSCWLHPRYHELVRLLDMEVMRITLRPSPDDLKLETVQGLLLCAHWMPLDVSTDKKQYRFRFSEGGAWQCLGLAIRWATFLALERSCHLSFHRLESVTKDDARRYRTMLYLTESDHYLALSARRPTNLDPGPLHSVLANFLRCKDLQNTDGRLISLFRVAYSAQITGCRPTTIESVEAFDKDVQLIERQFLLSLGDRPTDTLNQHFPFTSLRWYRLSYACAFLANADPVQRTGKALTWAIEWASQILIHLSTTPSINVAALPSTAPLEPNPSIVDVMSFAIDHYFVVIAYAAFFLVNVWWSNQMDSNLQPHPQQGLEPMDASTSLLCRLVDVAARTLEAASPPEGHLARRYVAVLRGMTGIIQSGKTQAAPFGADASGMATYPNAPDMSGNLEEDLWSLWQNAELDTSLAIPNLLDGLFDAPQANQLG
ncbi:hypothetical protein EHS25_000594 [Saitozyma podzolica]|uniref:Zn(2)-C6 fungal-type domain-containing protein n=1 Tax=Saitozyma podzolica TaxID=1890683 RepID=A0A427YWM2_9TREE|nr:hypothetical protein EHS25_000594 [Saitozyma podzolica]